MSNEIRTPDFANARITFPDAVGSIPLSRRINHVYGQTAVLITRPPLRDASDPSPSGSLFVSVESGAVRLKPGNNLVQTLALSGGALSLANHRYDPGEGPIRFSNVGSITGIAINTDYYVNVITEGSIKVATNPKDAREGTNLIALAGSGNAITVGMPGAPTNPVLDWSGSLKIVAAQGIVVLSAPAKITMVGVGATDLADVWFA